MSKYKVTIFQPYDFAVGQKIRIQGGPRGGDWEVSGVSDKKVTLRCPVSGREFSWARFCYLVEEGREQDWPQED